jgi:hypothetical protein
MSASSTSTATRACHAEFKLALSRTEAALALGMSVDHFDRHVMPDLRVVRCGRLVLVPVRELTLWLDEHGAYPLARQQ